MHVDTQTKQNREKDKILRDLHFERTIDAYALILLLFFRFQKNRFKPLFFWGSSRRGTILAGFSSSKSLKLSELIDMKTSSATSVAQD